MSKTITSHPAVSHLDDCSDSDYKYYVILKDGYVFGSGRNAGADNMRFNSVADFRSYAGDIRPRDKALDDELQGIT